MPYFVVLTDDAERDLDKIKDQKTYSSIERKLDELQDTPDKRGKALQNVLKGYRSVRAAGQRYRIIYWVDINDKVTTVEVIGIRREGDKKDVYRIAAKRLPKK